MFLNRLLFYFYYHITLLPLVMYVNINLSILLWTLQNIASLEHRRGEGYSSCIRSDEQSGVFTHDDVYSFGRGVFIRLRVSLYENRLGPLFRRTSHTWTKCDTLRRSRSSCTLSYCRHRQL